MPAMTDVNAILASEANRRAHVGLPPLTPVEQLEHLAQQLLPCLQCEQWQSAKARGIIGATFLGLVTREEAMSLFQRGLCCKGASTAIFTYLQVEPIPRSEEANGRWWGK
jgi:hypothetical protein